MYHAASPSAQDPDKLEARPQIAPGGPPRTQDPKHFSFKIENIE
jgi:hypothetical protein